MPTLFDTVKAKRRLLAPLVPLCGAGGDYLLGNGENVRGLLTMAAVFAWMYLPSTYFEYRPRPPRAAKPRDPR